MDLTNELFGRAATAHNEGVEERVIHGHAADLTSKFYSNLRELVDRMNPTIGHLMACSATEIAAILAEDISAYVDDNATTDEAYQKLGDDAPLILVGTNGVNLNAAYLAKMLQSAIMFGWHLREAHLPNFAEEIQRARIGAVQALAEEEM